MSEEAITEMYLAKLAQYMNKVPEAVNSGSWQTAVKFKDWAAKAIKATKKTRVTQQELNALISQYEGFK